MDPGGPRMSLLLGIMLIIDGAYSIITGRGGYAWGKFPLPDWVGLIFLPMGIAICVLSVRALRRGEGKPKKYTDEDVAKAKAELDRMYLKEHGVLPEEKKDA